MRATGKIVIRELSRREEERRGGAGSISVNLTDGARIWGRRRFRSHLAALGHVAWLVRFGNQPAFMSAYRWLCDRARSELTGGGA